MASMMSDTAPTRFCVEEKNDDEDSANSSVVDEAKAAVEVTAN